MIDPKYIELMNLELDGTATPAEREDLRRHLSSHPEASAHFEELGGLLRRLDAEPLAEPPVELHPRIISAVDRAVRTPSREAGFGTWLGGLFAPPRRRSLGTFGLGVATGAFVLGVFQFGWSDIDPSLVSGTMAPPAIEQVASIELDQAADGLGGSLELYDDKGITVIAADLSVLDPVHWILEFDAGLSVRRIDAPATAAIVFGASPGEVHARHAGDGKYRIVLSGRAEPVESVILKVVRDGEVVAERPAAPIRR
jgi:hypothetical protein